MCECVRSGGRGISTEKDGTLGVDEESKKDPEPLNIEESRGMTRNMRRGSKFASAAPADGVCSCWF